MANSILLNVDDHEVARYARTRILTSAGFTVYEAATGYEALEMVSRHRPDLILLDVHLPDISGLEVCRRLKERVTEYSFIILQVTASAVTASHATSALDGGADAYLTEPLDPDVLVATVRAMLRLHHAERSLAHANRNLEISNRELVRSNADLAHFAFAASHDLQEPLRMITIFSQLIQHEASGKLAPQEREYLATIVSSAGRMSKLISDLLSYSQVGRESAAKSVVNLQDVIVWAVTNLKESIEELGATVEVAPNLPSILGDFSLLGQVFQNLISNALKYRRTAVPVSIRIDCLRAAEATWEITVSDNGSGIPSAYCERVFKPFERLHGAEVPGSGIGLALCRRIIEAHGGRIWARSDIEEGTAFSFTLAAA